MAIHDSSSDSDERPVTPRKLFGRRRPLFDILGGGTAAKVLLWEDKRVSGAILAGVTAIWLLFEAAEYNFVSLLCHISITVLLVVFIWANLAAFFDRDPPKLPEMILSEHAFRQFAQEVHAKLSGFLYRIHDVACGNDLKMFILTIITLYIISVMGSCCTTSNLLYMGFLFIHTVPALYVRYEDEVDHFATRGSRDAKKLYRKFDKKVLNKIPRGPVKEKNK